MQCTQTYLTKKIEIKYKQRWRPLLLISKQTAKFSLSSAAAGTSKTTNDDNINGIPLKTHNTLHTCTCIWSAWLL